MNGRLDGKVALITGASRGIGRAFALELASRGAACALVARRSAPLDDVAAEVRATGAEVVTQALDITESGAAARVVRDVLGELGRIDVLINNAGRGHHELFEQTTSDDVAAILDVNLVSLLNLTQAAIPTMRSQGGGTIVNVASAAGVRAFPTAAVYSAAKHAVVGFSSALRRELAPLGIGVTVVCPDYVEATGFFASAGGRPSPEPAHGLAPERVAREAMDAALDGRAIVVRPRSIRWRALLGAVSPSFDDRAFRRRVDSFLRGAA